MQIVLNYKSMFLQHILSAVCLRFHFTYMCVHTRQYNEKNWASVLAADPEKFKKECITFFIDRKRIDISKNQLRYR